LETISFGLYAIVHPNDYDGETGKWRDPKQVTSSGAYECIAWDEGHMTLKLRDSFPADLRHPSAAKEVSVVWGKSGEFPADMELGNDLASDEHPGAEFFGSGTINVYTYYVHVLSWAQANTQLANSDLRAALRTRFYKNLEAKGTKIVRSFLPLGIPGIVAFDDPPVSPCVSGAFKLNVPLPRFPGKTFLAIFDSMKAAVSECGGEPNVVPALSIKEIREMADPSLSAYKADLTPRGTGLLVEDPLSDGEIAESCGRAS
jgi:hypothetical protein